MRLISINIRPKKQLSLSLSNPAFLLANKPIFGARGGIKSLSILVLCSSMLNPLTAAADDDLLSFYKDKITGNYIKGDLTFATAQFVQGNSWAGNDEELLGDDSDSWSEYGIKAGIEGTYHIPGYGRFLTRVSAVYSGTRGGLDAGGSNLDNDGHGYTNPSKTTFEDVFVRWSSGDLFSNIGTDALEISAGSQVYKQGTGFLFYDAGSDGGRRGGFWLGMRKAYQHTGIVKFKTGNWMAEGYYLEPDSPGEKTRMGGMNIEYDFGHRGGIGASYTKVFNADDDRRDGLDIFDIRGDIRPFEQWPGLHLDAEYANEDNGNKNDSWAGYGRITYAFSDAILWSPKVFYRYAHFSGDDEKGDNNAFDPINYGFNDWDEWFVGEIIGEYVTSNRNLNSHTLNLSLSPTNDLSLGLYYIHFRLDEKQNKLTPRPPTNSRAALINDKDLGHEVNLTVDWKLTDQIYVGMMGGIVFPEDGAEDFFGDDENWTVFMLTASYSF